MQRGEIHQDWETVVFKKKPKQQQSSFNAPDTKKRRELDGEDIVVPIYVNQEQSQNLIEARNAKGWKQIDLAKACNYDVSIVKSYENKTAIYNKKIYDNLLKKMNIIIKV